MNEVKPIQLHVEITSFSYKLPLPPLLFSFEDGRRGGGFVFDCRCLPNPGRLEEFKSQTGRDKGVIEYLLNLQEVLQFRQHASELICAAVETHLSRSFGFLSVGFGCTGGQHRSVFMSEQLAAHLREKFSRDKVTITVTHSNLDPAGKPIPLSQRTLRV